MSNLGVNVAVIQDGKILLTRRDEWFPFDAIPSPLSIGHERRIRDAVEGACEVAVLQEIKSPEMRGELTRDELYERRDRSGLSRQGFYLRMIEGVEVEETVEVDGR